MTLALLERVDERLTPLERLEALTDPGSLQPLRTQVRSRRMGDRARPGDGVLAAHAQDRRAPGVLLRAGRVLRRRLARRGPCGHGRGGAAHGRARARARPRVHRVRRRPHAGGPGRPVRLRADLLRARAAVGSHPADIDRVRALGRRSLLRTGAQRLRDHERPRGHVPDRAGRRRRGDRRAAGRRARWVARACTSATGSATSRRPPRPTRRSWRATCSTICPSTPASQRRCGPRCRRRTCHRTGPCPHRRARSMTCAT